MSDEALHVLVVDGSDFDREAIARVTAKLGYVVEAAATLAEARTAIRASEGRFNLAVVEAHLPDGLGLALLPELRLPPTPCATVFTAGANIGQAAELAVAQGVHRLLRKPFTPYLYQKALESAAKRTDEMRLWLDPERVGRRVDSWIDMVVAGAGQGGDHTSEKPIFLERMTKIVVEKGELSPAMARIVPNLLMGHSYAEIAEQHDISTETVKTHVRAILGRLHISSAREIWQVCVAAFDT